MCFYIWGISVWFVHASLACFMSHHALMCIHAHVHILSDTTRSEQLSHMLASILAQGHHTSISLLPMSASERHRHSSSMATILPLTAIDDSSSWDQGAEDALREWESARASPHVLPPHHQSQDWVGLNVMQHWEAVLQDIERQHPPSPSQPPLTAAASAASPLQPPVVSAPQPVPEASPLQPPVVLAPLQVPAALPLQPPGVLAPRPVG